MPTREMTRYIGVVNVILASGKKQESTQVESLHYKGLDTRSVRNASCVGSKHRTKHNWTFYSLTVILGILMLLT